MGDRIRYYSQFPEAIPKKGVRSHALLTRPPLGIAPPLDLHVLGLPPAFVLSQDQTLKLKATLAAILDVEPSHICPSSRSLTDQSLSMCSSCRSNKNPQDSEADTHIIASQPAKAKTLVSRYANSQTPIAPKPPTYPFNIQMFKEQGNKTDRTRQLPSVFPTASFPDFLRLSPAPHQSRPWSPRCSASVTCCLGMSPSGCKQKIRKSHDFLPNFCQASDKKREYAGHPAT